MKGGRYASALGPGSANAGATPDSTPIAVTATIRTRIPLSRLTLNLKKFGAHIDEVDTGCAGADYWAHDRGPGRQQERKRSSGPQDQPPYRIGILFGRRCGAGPW